MIVPGTARAKLHSAGAALHRGPHGRGAQHPILDHLPLELPGRSLTETGPGAVRLSPKSLPPPIPQFHFAPRIQAEEPSKKFHETTDAQLGVPCVQRSQAASRPRRATQGSEPLEKNGAAPILAAPSPRIHRATNTVGLFPLPFPTGGESLRERPNAVVVALAYHFGPTWILGVVLGVVGRNVFFSLHTSECELINQNPRHFVSSSAQ